MKEKTGTKKSVHDEARGKNQKEEQDDKRRKIS